jgi:DNA repair exonuclease SbcCD nuclease subunit
MEVISDKLMQISRIVNKEEIDAVIDGGDVFDKKSPSMNSHSMVRQLADIHNKFYNCKVYCNVGNHDCVYGDIAHIDSQPLGVLFSTGVFKRLYYENELVLIKDGIKVRVVGVPYHGVKYDLEKLNIKKGDEDYLVINAHLLASKQGGSMFESEDIVSYDYLSELDADVWCFGHWHKDQGITEIASNKYVVNVGSLTRGSIAEDHLTRSPCVVNLIFSKSGIKINRIDLEVKPASVCFDIERKESVTDKKQFIDNFVNILKNSKFKTDRSSIYDNIRSWYNNSDAHKDYIDVVKERAIILVEEAEKNAR